MRLGRTHGTPNKPLITIVSADVEFCTAARNALGAGERVELRTVPDTIDAVAESINTSEAAVVVVDLDPAKGIEMRGLERLMVRIGAQPPVVVVAPNVDAGLARALVQMRVADFLTKPVQPAEMARTCERVAAGPAPSEGADAKIFTYLPAIGGAGVTTIAVQTALLLLNGERGKKSTCLVDLNFQNGACADYLDIEPRLNIGEIEPRPERLDRQLLEVMLSHHASGLAVVAAPNSPAEMRSFDPEVVTRLLDLVSSHFDNVVFDMPGTWFSWTDSVLLGSNKLFIVSQATVPGLRHAKQMVDAIGERLGPVPKAEVIINRFDQRLFSSGLRRADIEQVLGDNFATTLPNEYAVVREAIDRGVPLTEVKSANAVTAQIKKLILASADAPARDGPPAGKFKLSWAR